MDSKALDWSLWRWISFCSFPWFLWPVEAKPCPGELGPRLWPASDVQHLRPIGTQQVTEKLKLDWPLEAAHSLPKCMWLPTFLCLWTQVAPTPSLCPGGPGSGSAFHEDVVCRAWPFQGLKTILIPTRSLSLFMPTSFSCSSPHRVPFMVLFQPLHFRAQRL